MQGIRSYHLVVTYSTFLNTKPLLKSISSQVSDSSLLARIPVIEHKARHALTRGSCTLSMSSLTISYLGAIIKLSVFGFRKDVLISILYILDGCFRALAELSVLSLSI